MPTILGREPAVFWAAVAAILQALSLLLPLSVEQQGLVNAALVAAAGLVTAWYVSVDAALPLLTGVVKAVLAVLLGFGLHVSDTAQVTIMTLVTAVAAFWVRTQVRAPITAEGRHTQIPASG
jgi:hypothetical protein